MFYDKQMQFCVQTAVHYVYTLCGSLQKRPYSNNRYSVSRYSSAHTPWRLSTFPLLERGLKYFSMLQLPSINQIQKYMNTQQNAL